MYIFLENCLSSKVFDLQQIKDTSCAFEYCWYTLLKILTIEEKISAGNGPDFKKERHLELISNVRGILLSELNQFHDYGWISEQSPKDEIEVRLLALIKKQPDIKVVAMPILQNYDAQIEKGIHLKHLGMERHAELIDKEERLGMANKVDFQDELLIQNELFNKLRTIVNIVKPQPENEPAWHQPINYLESQAKGKSTIYFSESDEKFKWNGEELPNGYKFDFALMERLSESGFTNWLHGRAPNHTDFLHKWLKASNDSRSQHSLIETLQQYMDLGRGNRVPSLRGFLSLPEESEPVEVTREIVYWQELWEAKERSKAKILLCNRFDRAETELVVKWMKEHKEEKIFAITDHIGFEHSARSYGCSKRETSLMVSHRSSLPTYPFDGLNAKAALAYAAHEVGSTEGWGDYRSSAMPLKANEQLRSEITKGALRNEEANFDVAFKVLDTDGYIDAIVFTENSDNEHSEEYLETNNVDAGSPLVGSGK